MERYLNRLCYTAMWRGSGVQKRKLIHFTPPNERRQQKCIDKDKYISTKFGLELKHQTTVIAERAKCSYHVEFRKMPIFPDLMRCFHQMW